MGSFVPTSHAQRRRTGRHRASSQGPGPRATVVGVVEREALRQQSLRVGPTVAMAVASTLLAVASPALAVDTVETWDVGATDLDFYLGYEGLGSHREERRLSGEIMLGCGLIERLSAYLGASLSASELLSGASADLFLGIFGTPVDTAHFDLDLFLDVGSATSDRTELALTPAMELNVDADPEMGSFGAYLLVGFPIYGRPSGEPGGETSRTEVAGDLEATVGAYLTFADGHQMLLAYDMLLRIEPAAEERAVEIGGVSLGYNVTVHEGLELISEIRLDIPQDDEQVVAGFVLGLIATVPSGR